MQYNKTVNILVWGASALALILAIVTAVFAFNTETTYVKVMLFITVFLFLALAGLVGYLAFFDMAKVVPNEGGSRHNPIPHPRVFWSDLPTRSDW